MSKPVRVQIYDQSYLIGGDLEEAYVQKLAGFVDNKMRDVAEATHTVDSLKVAVLSALAIADELHSLRNERETLDGTLREQAERCLTLVERALKQTA
jgi:cell division protein ZapA